MRQKLDIIWNISLICPWDCEICCVDAVHVSGDNSDVIIRSNTLNTVDILEKERGKSIFDLAAERRQKQGLELNLEQKLQVLENLRGNYIVKINLSGGDPLVVSENLHIIKMASELFGKNNTQISTTGAGLSRYKPEELASFIGKLKFSYDGPNGIYNPNRPLTYNDSNLRKASRFSENGIFTIAEVPLSVRNIDPLVIALLYENLSQAKIDQALIMRLFPVCRGMNVPQELPTREQYLRAIEKFKELEKQYKKPEIRLQCALKHLYNENRNNESNPCDLFRESFAITSKGILITSAWAIGPTGEPLDEAFVLGDVSKNHIEELLRSEKARYYQEHLADNFGQCKIFSYLNSRKQNPLERIHDKSDPLYVSL